jgi:hypothetical protein
MDTILALLVDSDNAQRAFTKQSGIDRILRLSLQKKTSAEVRYTSYSYGAHNCRSKCGEFFSFVLRYFVHDADGEKKRLAEFLGSACTAAEIYAILGEKVHEEPSTKTAIEEVVIKPEQATVVDQ